MPRARIRSAKDPGFWAPLAVGLLVGPLLLFGLDVWMDQLRALARLDPDAAARAAEQGLRWFGRGLAAFLVLFSALVARSCQLGLREGRFPPSGWWSLGSIRVATGATARRTARWGLVLALALAALGVATAPVFQHFVDAFHASHP